MRDRSILVAAGVGLALGAFSVLADGVIPSRAVVILGNIIAPWAIAAFAVGRCARSWGRGGAAGTLALVIGVAAYYAGHAVRVAVETGAPATDAAGAVPLLWLVVAVTIGPPLGIAGAASARHRPVPMAAVALPSAVLLAELGFLVLDRRPWLWVLPREPHRLVDLAIWLGLAALAIAIPVRGVRDRRRRLTTLSAAMVAGIGGSLGLAGLYRLIVLLP